MTRRALMTIPLPPASELERLVRASLEELRNPLTRSTPALAALSRALSIDKLAAGCNAGHLVIVPHGILHDIPFEALLDGSGHPLVERFAISYAPSASSLAFLRSTPAAGKVADVTVLAIANPIVASGHVARNRQVDLAHINLLQPVPESAEEVRGIAAIFGRSARVLDGARATRSELDRADLGNMRILHFATHGLIDEDRPERSGLVLTADPPRDDGLLQMRDIYSLRLHADLVTLSACETALGRHASGEGIIGLTRAFFYAGAQAVVASLWDVDDAATSLFMQRFYRNVRRGQAIDVALQQAKLEFIHEGGQRSAPFYWASFVVSGQARPAIAAPAAPSRRLPVAGVLAGLVIVTLLSYWTTVNVRRGDVVERRP